MPVTGWLAFPDSHVAIFEKAWPGNTNAAGWYERFLAVHHVTPRKVAPVYATALPGLLVTAGFPGAPPGYLMRLAELRCRWPVPPARTYRVEWRALCAWNKLLPDFGRYYWDHRGVRIRLLTGSYLYGACKWRAEWALKPVVWCDINLWAPRPFTVTPYTCYFNGHNYGVRYYYRT